MINFGSKIRPKIGKRNVKTMYDDGKLEQVLREMEYCALEVLGRNKKTTGMEN
jgi:hypothetical protein